MNILFLGDSITDCDHNFTEDNLGNGYVKKLSFLPGISAANGGTNGFTFPDVLRKWRLMYAQNKYDYVVITCGINDAGAAADLEESGRHTTACEFLEESMSALRTLLNELSNMADMQKPSSCRQRQNKPAPSSVQGTMQNKNNTAPPAAFPRTSEILLLEPFLFPVPQARIHWLPTLREVRIRMRKEITAFNAARTPIREKASGLDTESRAKRDCLLNIKSSYAGDASCARYIPTQAALDELVSELGYPAVTTDGIHLSDKGHTCLARLVADALRGMS